MPPKLQSEDRRHVVIRPLAYVAEHDIQRYANAREFPIIPCKLCGSQDNMQRKAIKQMLQQWEHDFPGRTETIFSALKNVVPSHLADTQVFDFSALSSLNDIKIAAAEEWFENEIEPALAAE
jgi:tRNA 2-thiocytidine biosynthesis protein TtcA